MGQAPTAGLDHPSEQLHPNLNMRDFPQSTKQTSPMPDEVSSKRRLEIKRRSILDLGGGRLLSTAIIQINPHQGSNLESDSAVVSKVTVSILEAGRGFETLREFLFNDKNRVQFIWEAQLQKETLLI